MVKKKKKVAKKKVESVRKLKEAVQYWKTAYDESQARCETNDAEFGRKDSACRELRREVEHLQGALDQSNAKVVEHKVGAQFYKGKCEGLQAILPYLPAFAHQPKD